MHRTIRAFVALPAAAILFLAACGGGDTDSDPAETVEVSAIPDDEDPVTAPAETDDSPPTDEAEAKDMAEDMAKDMVERLEDQQEAEGGGRATFTAGDETWEFDSVVCVFNEEGDDEDAAEFILSSLQDGLQLHLMISSLGHTMSLDDVTDFENPSVALTTPLTGADDFLVVDGKNVSGETFVLDGDDATLTEIPATVEATCP